MAYHTMEETLTRYIGDASTPERQEFDNNVETHVELCNIGEAIKKARLQKGMSQDALGKMIGVKRSRMSQIEKGEGLTFSTITRSLRALNIPTSIVMEGIGTVRL